MGKKILLQKVGFIIRKRDNTVYKHVHLEQKDADFSTVRNCIGNKWLIILAEFSAMSNVYSADETAFFNLAFPKPVYLFGNEHTKCCKIA